MLSRAFSPVPVRRRRISARLMVLLFISLFAIAGPSHGDVVTFSAEDTRLNPTSAAEVLPPQMPFPELEEVMRASNWRPVNSEVLNLDHQAGGVWIRFPLSNPSTLELHPLLELAYATLDQVDIYRVRQGKIAQRFRGGDRVPFNERPLHHRFVLAPLDLAPQSDHWIYIHAQSAGPLKVPLTLWERDAFMAHDQARQLLYGLYFGAMLIMLIYNFFIYLAVGDRSYLYYLGTVLGITLLVATLSGYAFQILWPGATEWNQTAVGFTICLSIAFGALFTARFLGLHDRNANAVTRGLLSFTYATVAIMILSLFTTSYPVMLAITSGGAVLACLVALALGLYTLWLGETSARHYVLAWGSLLVGAMILAGHTYRLVPHNIFTQNAVLLGSALLVALLSFALASRINEERRQREQAQQIALEHERRARLAREEANRELENRVQERTRELEAANKKLEALSSTDPLTGLYNRRYLDTALAAEHNRSCRHGHALSLIFIDIDHFKRVNDELGHQMGDRYLVRVAETIASCLERKADLAARFGGEEFCVLLPETECEGAAVVAERIRAAVGSIRIDSREDLPPLAVSLGVACEHPQRPDEGRSLVRAADEALYASKARGRNCVTCAPASTPD